MTLGESIRKVRTEKKLTQKQLGDACGIAESAIRRYESGRVSPKLETLGVIAAALGTTCPALLANTDDAKRFLLSGQDFIIHSKVGDILLETQLPVMEHVNEDADARIALYDFLSQSNFTETQYKMLLHYAMHINNNSD